MDNSDLLGAPEPTAPAQSEFLPRPRPVRDRPHTVVIPVPPTEANEKLKKLFTQNQIRQMTMQLADRNLPAVETWLHKVSEDSPAKAVELFIELLKFSLPQLREATLNVTKDNVTRTFQSSADILAELNSPEAQT
jgi:hypothetical protein